MTQPLRNAIVVVFALLATSNGALSQQKAYERAAKTPTPTRLPGATAIPTLAACESIEAPRVDAIQAVGGRLLISGEAYIPNVVHADLDICGGSDPEMYSSSCGTIVSGGRVGRTYRFAEPLDVYSPWPVYFEVCIYAHGECAYLSRCTRHSTDGATLRFQPCRGDCNLDGVVDPTELQLAIEMASTGNTNDCERVTDFDRDGKTSIEEIVQVVRSAIEGCPR